MLESYCGQSLFWHDPCGSSHREPHYRPVHDSMSAPSWYAAQEFVPLFRDQRGSQTFQAIAFPEMEGSFDEDNNLIETITTYRRESVLGTNDFDTDFDGGIRVTLGRALGDWYRLEGSYLGPYEWSDWAAVRFSPVEPPVPFDPGTDPTFVPGTPPTFEPGDLPSYDPDDDPPFDPGTPPTFDPGTPATFDPGTPPTYYEPGSGLLSPFSNFGDPNGPPGLDELSEAQFIPDENFDYNDYARIHFRSRMNDGQLNLRRRVRMDAERRLRAEASWLLGLRYMNIGEEFGYQATSPLPDRVNPHWRNVQTENKMFGIQIGSLSQFLVVDRGWIDFEIKGVMFFNDASNRIETQFGEEPIWVSQADKDRTAFMGDLSLNFNYQFAPSWTFRAGYNGLWLSGVALASENFLLEDDPLLGDHRSSLDHSGRLVYHGPSIGLVFVH